MKYIYTTLAIAFFLTDVINAQDLKLEKQKGYKYKRSFVLDSLNIPEPDFRIIEIELQIHYVAHYIADARNSKLVIINKDKNGIWSGKSYYYYYYNDLNYDFKNVSITPVIFKSNWSTIWQNIITENYLNMPTESDIRLNPPFRIADGEYCGIQILTKKVKRRISYSNPDTKYRTYIDEYNTEIAEFKEFSQFFNLLKEELSF